MLPKQPLIRAVSTQRVSVASKASAKGESAHRAKHKGGRRWYGKQQNWSFIMVFWNTGSASQSMWWNSAVFIPSLHLQPSLRMKMIKIHFIYFKQAFPEHSIAVCPVHCCHVETPIIQTSYKKEAWHLANFLKVCVGWQTMKAYTWKKKRVQVKPDSFHTSVRTALEKWQKPHLCHRSGEPRVPSSPELNWGAGREQTTWNNMSSRRHTISNVHCP